MDDKKITKEINLRSALKGEPQKNLKEILNLYDKDRLSDYYYAITQKEIKGNKKSLIDKIYKRLTDEEVICGFLNKMNETEYQEIVRLINSDGELQDDYIAYKDYYYLRSFGIVHTFNHQDNLYIIIPDEIIAILKNIDITKYHEKALHNSKLINLAYSMINLYGAVPFNIYLDYCNKYYNYDKFTEDDLACILEPQRLIDIEMVPMGNNFYMVKGEFLDETFASNYLNIHKIINKLEEDLFYMDYKKISLEDLLKYKEIFYYEETKEVKVFKKYLKAKNMPDENIGLLIGALTSTFRIDYNDGILFLNDMFDEEDFVVNVKNFDEIMNYVNNIVNNIPMWGNKGWTNKEIISKKCYEEMAKY